MLKKLVPLASCLLATASFADQFDYEILAGYQSSSSDSSFSSTLVPATTRSKSDGDGLVLEGSWYYASLSDDEGPRARAAFMSRASGATFGWSASDDTSRVTVTDPLLPPTSIQAKASIDDFSARVRHVWKETGWYALGGVARASTDIETRIDGDRTSIGLDATLYSIGVGKYVGQSTAVDFSVSQADIEGGDSTSYALTLTHIGDIGESWQYGLDLSAAQSDLDDDDGTYGVRFSLYPTRDVEFGIGISQASVGPLDVDSYEGFVSWFFRPNASLAVSYGEQDPDAPAGQDVDSSVTAFDIRVRF